MNHSETLQVSSSSSVDMQVPMCWIRVIFIPFFCFAICHFICVERPFKLVSYMCNCF